MNKIFIEHFQSRTETKKFSYLNIEILHRTKQIFLKNTKGKKKKKFQTDILTVCLQRSNRIEAMRNRLDDNWLTVYMFPYCIYVYVYYFGIEFYHGCVSGLTNHEQWQTRKNWRTHTMIYADGRMILHHRHFICVYRVTGGTYVDL